ncbi:hypothetical protein HDU96_000195 [Phlyctochytrium bullatum]|nr:hypothetical protein HDU96_000195 [Phlyctochytrium bullatum]
MNTVAVVLNRLFGTAPPGDLQRLLHAQSLADPEVFWARAAADVVWTKSFDHVLGKERYDPTCPRWFEGGEISACYNAVDRHVDEGNGDRPAIFYDSPFTHTKRTVTYSQLKHEVETLAAVLQSMGVKKGNTVLIFMPMVPEAVFGMLATARLGAVHSVVFGGFATPELAKRIEDCKPTVILYGACGFEPNKVIQYKPLVDAALSMCKHQVFWKLVFERPQCEMKLNPRLGELSWRDMVALAKRAGQKAECVPIGSNE